MHIAMLVKCDRYLSTRNACFVQLMSVVTLVFSTVAKPTVWYRMNWYRFTSVGQGTGSALGVGDGSVGSALGLRKDLR